jgi:hypothetical protein
MNIKIVSEKTGLTKKAIKYYVASSAKASQRPLGVTRMVSRLKTMNIISYTSD